METTSFGSRSLGSTYRLQLHGLGFEGARRLVGYLHRLGIETLYCSPILAAAAGSTHGYDVIDPNRLDPGLGTREEFVALLAGLADHGMRLLVDIVPNHLATSSANPWWWDTLRLGRESPDADIFDIDWSAHGGRILLPVLGKPLRDVLADDELSVVGGGGEPELAYFDHRFPIDPRSYPLLPGGPDDDDPTALRRLLDAQHYRLAFWRLGRRQGNYRRFFDIDTLVGVRMHDPAVYRRTHGLILDLLSDQRIAGVRVDHIDGLADPAGYLRRLRSDISTARTGEVEDGARLEDGTRVDAGALLDAGARVDAGAGVDDGALLVEKIVARGEELVPDWPVDGTTGYEFADLALGLFLYPPAGDPNFAVSATTAKREVLATLFAAEVGRIVHHITGLAEDEEPGLDLDEEDMRQAVVEITAQLGVYRTYLDGSAPSAPDRDRITSAAARAVIGLGPEAGRALSYFTGGLLAAPETRSRPVGAGWTDIAQRWQQLTGATAAKGVEDTALYHADRSLAAADVGGDLTDPAVTPEVFHAAMTERARRHPRTLNATSTHDSKRSEDVRTRLAVLTEWPEEWARQVGRWHRLHLPLVTADDVGVGEDDGAGEDDGVGGGAGAGGHAIVHPHDENLFYQSVVGAWPKDPDRRDDFTGRMAEYLLKATREAKVRSSWSDPDEGYESKLRNFVTGALDADDPRFVDDVDSVIDSIGPAATVNSLGLTALKLTVPGIPDIYQGSEMESLDLTDPDNRRPIDFQRFTESLDLLDRTSDPDTDLTESGATSLLASWWDGRAKLFVTHRLLIHRRSEPRFFDRSRYRSLRIGGIHHEHVVAFARSVGTRWTVTVVPRLSFSLVGPGTMPLGPAVWGDTTVVLPEDVPGEMGNVFTGRSVQTSGRELSVGQLLETFPVAVLTS